MYESCVSHQECSYQNPNLQCVDFLCYCPLPYVLTEAHRCLARVELVAAPVSYNNMVFTIVPTAVLIGALLMIGGAYTYKKVAGGSGGRWSSASSLFTLRSTTERPWESTRRASSAIRLNRKAGSGQRTRRPRRSLDEHREALWHARAPRHPPRYIRPREQSVQTSFLQDVRVKEESTLSSGSDSHREPARSTRTAASRQQSLSVHEGVSVHIIDKSPTSGRASQEVSNVRDSSMEALSQAEVPWLRQARGEVSRRESPTQLLRRVLDEAEVKINVERCGSFDLHDTEQPPLPKFFGDYSGSPVSKLQGSAKGESTTEDSFMREIRYQMKAALSRPSVQDRAMSTDAALTTDSAVQLDKTAPDHVDRSQQMSDAPSINKKPSIVYASGDSFSGSVETPSDESKLEGYVSPNSPRNNGPGQAISLSQELQTTQAVVNHGLERMFMFSRIENNWSLTSPKAILGSMDIESSETSLGGLRATFKQSAGACQMVVPRDEATVAVPARKDKKTKGSKQKKRVNFHEKPFADVLAEIEHSYSDPGKVKIMEGEKETSVSKGDTAAEVSAERSNNEDKESCDDIFMQYCRGAADKNSIRECESEDGKKEKTWTPPLSIEQDVGGQQVNTQIMEQVGAQAKHKEAGRSLVEWCGPHELAVRNNELSLSNSQEAVSEESLVSHPFCPSNEGPLVPSASATLSFLSSQSCVSVVHRMTDLTVLDSLADLATPFQETGDEKSRTAAANLPYTSKPDSRALKGIHHSLRGALEQYQQGEQQWKGHSLLSTSRQTSAERSACSSRRLRKLEQANRQDSREERSRPLKRPNTDESQHTVRFAAKEQRWGDDIIQVILIGNKHYLRERSLTSPRPLSPSMAAVSPLDETRYIAQQIELTHAIKEDVAHTCPSPELCLAAGVVRTVAVPEETVITPAYARDLSACDATRASARASDTGLDQKMPSSPSSKASPQSLPGACSGPLSGVRSPDSLGATHRGTWSPSGEQPKMETIADAVCEIELQDPQAVSEALGSKISESVTGDVFSGDKIQMDKSRVQISVIEGSTDHFVPSLTFELGSESRLTPTWPQWDAPTRDLLAPVKLLSAAVGTPESFSKTIGLPSAEGLLMSDTSTPASRVNTAVPSSMDCSVVLEASASALPHARTGRPKSVRSSSHSAKIIDGPCFESIYNSILQRGSSPGLSLSIPTLGSRDSAGLFGVRERPERSASEYSTILSRHDDSTDSGAVKIVATNSRSVSLAPGFSDPQPSESCFHQALVQRTIDAATVFVEDAKKSGDEQKKSTPPSSGETPPNYNSRRGVSHPSNDLPQGDVVVSDIQDDAGSDDDERSSFFSFEESASETSLLPDGANLDWSVSSPASRSRADRG
ncbi:uncharacterized protein LOC144129918 [Amblyomma americanum]